jgi:thioredoxin 1
MTIKNIQKGFGLLGAALILSWAGMVLAAGHQEVPVLGLVNLVDLGSDYCLPCKMMAPVVTKLEKDYKGKAAVVYIDIDKFPDQAKRFGIRVIPTQIFYDKKGKEVYRHEGFLSERDVVAQLKKMGVN